MRLAELNPVFLGAGGSGITCNGQPVPRRDGVGVQFDCPCGKCGMPCFVPFRQPLDGGPPLWGEDRSLWNRSGDTFDTLTLTPSILRSPDKGGCGWHGFVTNGEIVTA